MASLHRAVAFLIHYYAGEVSNYNQLLGGLLENLCLDRQWLEVMICMIIVQLYCFCQVVLRVDNIHIFESYTHDWPEATFFSVENIDKHWLLNGLPVVLGRAKFFGDFRPYDF